MNFADRLERYLAWFGEYVMGVVPQAEGRLKRNEAPGSLPV
jgi:hypothetical protein